MTRNTSDEIGPAAPLLRGFKAAAEAFRVQTGPATPFATPNTVALDLKAMRLCDDFTDGGAVPVIVHAPFAGTRDFGIAEWIRRNGHPTTACHPTTAGQ